MGGKYHFGGRLLLRTCSQQFLLSVETWRSEWGGFAVDNATLTRFFSLHFILPFVIAGIAGVHLLFLHQTGSNNPLGLNGNYDKIPFHRFLTSKDLFGFFTLFVFIRVICFFYP